MTMIVVDKELREKLKDMDHELVFRDEAGQTLGRYIPEADYMKMLYSQARHLFREEDLEKARQQKEEFTTAEVLDYLNKL
jgi:hypothetical protein